jgi:transposase
MRNGISITVSSADRRRLRALVKDRNAPQKHVWRAEIILLTADGVGTNEIMSQTGKSKTCVWRWQERFAQEGFEGLLRDKTRPSRIKPLGDEVSARIVALTLNDPPGETTHWTGALMAKAASVSVSSVQRIWRAHGLQPHRVRQFKLSNDPKFVDKLRDVVGLQRDNQGENPATIRMRMRRCLGDEGRAKPDWRSPSSGGVRPKGRVWR